MRSFKHEHGTPNKIIQQEEKSILLAVDRALASTPNSQIICRNGEIPMINFLNRYLSNTLRAVTGHFITPFGKISSQVDIIIVDSRYPLLSQNEDGSVLVMLHSVLWAIEVKINLKSSDIAKSWNDAINIMKLATEVEFYGDNESFASIRTNLIAYKCGQKLDTIEKTYEKNAKPLLAGLDIYILRFPKNEMPENMEIGGMLHMEPPFEDEEKYGPFDGYWSCFGAKHTPLSDFYYSLIQDCYYTLGTRDFSFIDIGVHVMKYMSWSTVLWNNEEQPQMSFEGLP